MDSFDLSGFLLVLCIGIGVVGLVLFLMLFRYVGLWFQAFVSGTPISLFNIIGMSLRKNPSTYHGKCSYYFL